MKDLVYILLALCLAPFALAAGALLFAGFLLLLILLVKITFIVGGAAAILFVIGILIMAMMDRYESPG